MTDSVKKNPNPDIDRLLVKCLLGEATAEEHAQVAAWTAADQEHQRYFEDFRRVWEETSRLAPADAMDENAAWERFRQSERFPNARPEGFSEPEAHPGGQFRIPGPREKWALVAAALILLAGIGTLWLVSNRSMKGGNDNSLLAVKTQALTRTDTLPDGTQVTLNAYSSLVFPQKFRQDARLVTLKGEGFFQVVHHAQQPFIVTMNGVTIRDLGTSFNVKSRNGATEIIVETGEVEVVSGAYHVKAGAGERVDIPDSLMKPLKTPSVDELYQYYRTKEFVCRKTPLWKLADVLSEAYHVHIVIGSESIRELPLTTTFSNEDLDSILNIVTQTFTLTLERNGQEIILKQ